MVSYKCILIRLTGSGNVLKLAPCIGLWWDLHIRFISLSLTGAMACLAVYGFKLLPSIVKLVHGVIVSSANKEHQQFSIRLSAHVADCAALSIRSAAVFAYAAWSKERLERLVCVFAFFGGTLPKYYFRIWLWCVQYWLWAIILLPMSLRFDGICSSL